MGVGVLIPACVGETTGTSFHCLLKQVGGYRGSGRAFSEPSSPGKGRRDDQSRCSASRLVYAQRQLLKLGTSYTDTGFRRRPMYSVRKKNSLFSNVLRVSATASFSVGTSIS